MAPWCIQNLALAYFLALFLTPFPWHLKLQALSENSMLSNAVLSLSLFLKFSPNSLICLSNFYFFPPALAQVLPLVKFLSQCVFKINLIYIEANQLFADRKESKELNVYLTRHQQMKNKTTTTTKSKTLFIKKDGNGKCQLAQSQHKRCS